MIFGAFMAANQQAPAQGGPAWGFLPMMVLIFVIFYVLLILPQRRRQKKHLEMVENLKPGDQIITSAGIYGTVMGVQKDRIEVKIASNVKIDITKGAVGVILGAQNSDKPVVR